MLERAVSLRRPGPYQLQAAIAAAHAEDRPKPEIVALYEALSALDPSPVVRLNHAVAVALAGDVGAGLELLDAIEGLDGYHLLHAARADLFRRLDRGGEAAESYRRALALTTNEAESRFLERRLGGLVVRARPPRRGFRRSAVVAGAPASATMVLPSLSASAISAIVRSSADRDDRLPDAATASSRSRFGHDNVLRPRVRGAAILAGKDRDRRAGDFAPRCAAAVTSPSRRSHRAQPFRQQPADLLGGKPHSAPLPDCDLAPS